MQTRQPEEQRRNKWDQIFDWGGNCWVLHYTPKQAENVLDQYGISDTCVRLHFWEGYNSEPERDYVVSIQSEYMKNGEYTKDGRSISPEIR